MLDDSKILELYVIRSEKAINETADKYGHYCHSIADRILRNDQESEECVNDTYLNAWNSIPPHMPEKLSSFLGKITRNLALKVWEKKHALRRGNGQVNIALSELSECVDMNSSVESESDRRRILETLNAFIGSLPENKRTIFVQRYWYLMSIKEISKQTGHSQAKLKSMLFRIREDLRKTLKEEELY